jgi:Fe-S oxidoreductase
MTLGKRVSAFYEEKCDLCGLCFNKCPVMKLPLNIAKEEVQNLIEGKESKHVLYKCDSCLSCNWYCPQGANPYNLVLEGWNRLYKKRGAPPLYCLVCPTEDKNIWQLLNVLLSKQEKKWISEWVNYVPQPNDEVLLIGNYTHLLPFIVGGTKLFKSFKPIDRIDQWEAGAYPYQLGYLDLVQKIAQRTKRDFDGWGVKTVMHTLDAVYYVFTEVHPKEMGVSHEQKFLNVHDWLLEKINKNEIKLPNKLDITVTVHDNCYSKAGGGNFWDPPREILKKCGCEIIEMKHIRENSLCCGFGSGCSWETNMQLPFDMISTAIKKFKEAEATGAKALISYCGGCIYLLWAAKELMGSKIDLYHIIEIVRLSMGEKIPYPRAHVSRAWDLIAIITYGLVMTMFKKNFYIKRITYDKKMSTFKPRLFPILRTIRLLFRVSLIRTIYKKMFPMLMKIIKK